MVDATGWGWAMVAADKNRRGRNRVYLAGTSADPGTWSSGVENLPSTLASSWLDGLQRVASSREDGWKD